MEKSVVRFFSLLVTFVVLLGILHFVHFGGFTGYSVLNYQTGDAAAVNANSFEERSIGDNIFYWVAVGILAFLVLFFVIRFILAHHKKTKIISHMRARKEPHLIELELS